MQGVQCGEYQIFGLWNPKSGGGAFKTLSGRQNPQNGRRHHCREELPQKKLTAFKNKEYDILLGTQMVAKGLDFENVTLVGVISIDQQLYQDDYKSLERAFDLLTQVVGRGAGGEFPARR